MGPTVGETSVVLIMVFFSAGQVLLMNFNKRTLFWILFYTFYWSAVMLVRACTRTVREQLLDLYAATIKGLKAKDILTNYTKFHKKLLTAFAMYNRAMIPFLMLNFVVLSFWIAAF